MNFCIIWEPKGIGFLFSKSIDYILDVVYAIVIIALQLHISIREEIDILFEFK